MNVKSLRNRAIEQAIKLMRMSELYMHIDHASLYGYAWVSMFLASIRPLKSSMTTA